MTATTTSRPPRVRKIAPAGLDMTDRQRWLELRRDGIGGSDAPAILGLDDHHTAWQIWQSKVGLDDDTLSDAQREAIEFGHEMEAVIARVWARRVGIPGKLQRAGMMARTDIPWMRVNLDRVVTDCGCGEGPCLLECKNRSAWVGARWDAAGDPDKVPDAPVIQVQHALMVTGYSHGHLAAVIGGNQLRHYTIDADAELQATLAEEERWFWEQHVLTRTPPPIDASERTSKILAKLWEAEEDKIKEIGAEQYAAVVRLRKLVEQRDTLGTSAELIRAELKQWLGDAEIAIDPKTGGPVFTWKRNGTFSEKHYRETHPKIRRALERTVRKIDTVKLADADPDGYRASRARTFRLSSTPEET